MEKLKDIKLGFLHIVGLTISGEVYVAGKNNYGQLGINPMSVKEFKKIENIPIISKIFTGECDTILISEDSEYFCYGKSERERIKKELRKIPNNEVEDMIIGKHFIVVLKTSGEIVVIEKQKRDANTPLFPWYEESQLKDIKSINGGLGSYYFLNNFGEVIVAGRNSESEMGIGCEYGNRSLSAFVRNKYLENVDKVVCADFATAYITKDKEIFVSGYNGDLRLGVPYKNVRENLPIKLKLDFKVKDVYSGGSVFYIVSDNGKLYQTESIADFNMNFYHNNKDYKPFQSFEVFHNIQKIESNGSYQLILTKLGKLYGRGKSDIELFGFPDESSNYDKYLRIL